ncbi:hypothetical protein GTU79_14070 [Sodalis ligni]|uniref:hypothetical protein n=1 Tax=Sodalis ligni TaxID=2697027 RepID=UPI001BDDDDCB|nr:hypothetical protein [Sodalis ligni]QWA13597.1 hypothetical protein GTU79_14070 [Sodalis ligni]
MAKNDALKRLFAGGSSVMLTRFQEDTSLLSIPIYKTELNRENFAILLKVADEQAANAPLLEKYGLIFVTIRFAICLKKNNLVGLSGAEINEALARYPRLLETGKHILGVLPGKTLYKRPMTN